MNSAHKTSAIFVTVAAVVIPTIIFPTSLAVADSGSLYVAANGGVNGAPVAINDSGELLAQGYITSTRTNVGYLVRKDGSVVRLKGASGAQPGVVPSSLNNATVSVGVDFDNNILRWSQTGVPTRLTLPAGSTGPAGLPRIDNNGVIVAAVSGPDSTTQIVKWSNPARPRVILSAASGNVTVYGVSPNSGFIAGVLNDRAIVIDVTGHVQKLPAPPGSTSAVDVNDAGTAVGYAATAPVIWPANQRPRPLADNNSEVAAINNDGTVVGSRQTGGSDSDAFVRTADGTNIVLPRLRGGGPALATCINENGVIAGVSGGRATVWTRRS